MIQKKEDKIVDEISALTIHISITQWCQNLADNIKTIKANSSIGNLTCKTYPNCFKVSKLQEYALSDKETDIKIVSKECGLTNNQIAYLFDGLFYEYSFAGSDICSDCKEYTKANKPCLIIGGGPSIKKYNHIKLLKEHGFNGDIIATDSIACKLLEEGIIPTYMNSADASPHVKNLINYDVMHKYSDKITGLFSTVTHPSVLDIFKGKKYFYNSYINQEITDIFFLMTNIPRINSCGNVGSSSIILAHYLGYNPIIFIGMDLSFESEEDMKIYHSDNTSKFNPNNRQIDWTKHKYKIETNPIYNKKYYMDKVFEFYKSTLLYNMKEMAKDGINLINCTEQGALYGKDIKNITFEEYLKHQEKI